MGRDGKEWGGIGRDRDGKGWEGEGRKGMGREGKGRKGKESKGKESKGKELVSSKWSRTALARIISASMGQDTQGSGYLCQNTLSKIPIPSARSSST